MVEIRAVVRVLLLSLTLSLWSNLGYCAFPSTPADPCQSMNVTKLSVPIQVGQNGGFELVPGSRQSIHVCGFSVSPPGGGQFQFAYGSSCSAASVPPLTALTGQLYMGSFITPLSYSGPGTIFSVPAGNALCLVTNIPVDGIVTYTQP